MSTLKRNIDIIIILLIGFALRFTISFTHSYSNDELSAINRLQYNNFSDLIEFGVKTGDMHPAGVQVFMKMWSKVAGMNELGMRFPFVICGTLSILLIFLIGKKWMNRQTGLIAAILLALLYFPIMNSEFARPYSPGLLFSLLAAWYYLKLLFDDERKWKDAIFLGLSVAAAMYTHHFAFLFVGWLCTSGLIFARKHNFKYILVAGVIGIGLYVPHIPVTQYQLSVGGLQWLGPPDSDWLFGFLFHAFNESWIVIGMLSVLCVAAYFFKDKVHVWNKKALILSVVWFFGIYLVAHIYSLTQTPVLKYPVMLFALPFFFLLIGFWLSRFKHQGALFSVMMIVLAFSTTREKELFGNMHYELFEEIAADIVRWNEDYGEENIYTVYNINNPNYMNFYANQWDKEIHFDWDVLEFGSDVQLREDLISRDEKFCIVGYSARLTLPQVFETCKEFYPNILEYKKYNNAAVFLLAKEGIGQGLTQKKASLAYCNSNYIEGWSIPEGMLRSDTLVMDYMKGLEIPDSMKAPALMIPVNGFVLGGDDIYGPSFAFDLSMIEKPSTKYIRVEIKADMEVGGQLTCMVSGERNGEQIVNHDEVFWLGRDLEKMIETSQKGYFTFKIPDFIKEGDVLKIGTWSRNPEAKVVIKSVHVEVYDNIWN